MPDERISHYLCIGCPMGCRLEVEDNEAGEVVEVRGWGCKEGKAYGPQEHTNPRRMVATSVRINGARWGRLPVRTSASVPKLLVRAVVGAVRMIEVEAPIAVGTVILPNVLGTGVDVVATRDMERV
jgi:CxxC motif-containing protein